LGALDVEGARLINPRASAAREIPRVRGVMLRDDIAAGDISAVQVVSARCAPPSPLRLGLDIGRLLLAVRASGSTTAQFPRRRTIISRPPEGGRAVVGSMPTNISIVIEPATATEASPAFPLST
jgi:hypothetical protein